MTIDATTDDSFAANGNRPAIILDGNNSFSGDGLVLTSTADGSAIRGFVIRDFSGDGIEIQANSNNNTIAGNYIGRLTATGTDAGAGEANTGAGINLLGNNNTIGGLTTADRNVIAGNSDGIYLQGTIGNPISGNTIIGNYIGTDAAGLLDLGNIDRGIQIESGANNTIIGGTVAAARNVISGNNNDGIIISDGANPGTGTTGTVIQGNYIGVGSDGLTAIGNGTNGVRITTESGHTIGGTAAGAGNVIAYSTEDGVMLQNSSAVNNAILGNSIYANGTLGIDLGNNGVTANDGGDGDSGANNLQNFPALTSANSNATGTTIVGTLNSNSSTTYRIEFFASRPTIADSLNGEGERYLGFATVTTDGSGNATINTTLSNVWVNSGDKISATATVDLGGGNYGSTSEFAANVTATSTGIIVVDTTSDVSDGTTTSIANLGNARGADGRISLREAIAAANATANGGTPDKIVFDIPYIDGRHYYYTNDGVARQVTLGNRIATTARSDADLFSADPDFAKSWWSIKLSSTILPTITQAVTIDASTQAGFAGTPIIEIDASSVVNADPNAFTLTGSNVTIRGLVINRAGDDAIEIDVGATNTMVVGNYLGTDISGTIALPNQYGITVKTDGNIIGGTTALDRNVIAGNNTTSASYGVGFWQDADNNTVQGNYIGVGADGVKALGNRDGILFASSQTPDNNVIGGTTTSAANVIANNTQNGVTALSGIGNAFLGNAIYSNTLLGINLGTAGVTANDVGDGDTGANSLQNFPVLTSANSNASGTTIVGSLNSNANTTYRIEFFANRPAVADAANGEGERYLGYTTVTTNGSGNASFNTTLANVWVNSDDRVTATATVDLGGGNYGSTSEFAANVTATSTGIIVVDTTSDVADGTTTSITNLGNSRGADGRISLREAITAANNTANGGAPDKIVFNIAGGGSQVITPLTALPSLTDAVVIDGTTQTGWIVDSYLPIVLDGNDLNAHGLNFASGSSGSIVRGLVVRDFGQAGILANSGGGMQIVGNFIGAFNSDGTVATAAEANTFGIQTTSGANLIGGTAVGDRNYIGGNSSRGIELFSNANVIQGNVIGVATDGTTANGNTNAGIVIWSSSNLIGGTAAGTGNVMANSLLYRGISVRAGTAIPSWAIPYTTIRRWASTSTTTVSPSTTSSTATLTLVPTTCRTSRC